MSGTEIGKGGGGQGGGHGGHGHGGHHGGGLRGGGWRGGGWYGPWVYDSVPSAGVEITDLLAAADDEEDKRQHTKDVAKEVVKQLKKEKVSVGNELDMLDADLIGEDKDKDKGKADSKDKPSGSVLDAINPAAWLQTAGTLFQTGLNIYDKEEETKKAGADKAKSAADEQQKLTAAIAADSDATIAAARAAFSAHQKLASAQVDASAAAAAASAQPSSSGLSPEALGKRIEAARKALSAATTKAQAAPKDPYALALMNAWQVTLNRLQNAQIAPAGGGPHGGAGKSPGWLEGKTGPVPNKAIVGVGALGALALAAKRFLKK